ncbi:MAG: hypothetical protein AOA65_0448 [Candidatus Bathyarchaeota archaeon BA1]|nr:MAG: hypothetical protein AOA65_0448 [Candidatus Bathyarchaeota archaeon BA1]
MAMEFIKSLREAMKHIKEATDVARRHGELDGISLEDLASAHSSLDKVLFRMVGKGRMDPKELEESIEELTS